jgi:hypothetical protein
MLRLVPRQLAERQVHFVAAEVVQQALLDGRAGVDEGVDIEERGHSAAQLRSSCAIQPPEGAIIHCIQPAHCDERTL